MRPLIYIAIAANGLAFIQMGIDKRLAVRGKHRIPEAQLIAPVLLSGIIGIVLGMRVFRHKTAKRSFQIKLALAFLLFAIGVYLTYFIRA
jgi:uncharacterized membrane protein YsdA (DUF1294 family)